MKSAAVRASRAFVARNFVEVGQEPCFTCRVEEYGFGADAERAAEIGRVVGIAHQDGGLARDAFAPDGGQAGVKQAFARAVERENFMCWIDGAASA